MPDCLVSSAEVEDRVKRESGEAFRIITGSINAITGVGHAGTRRPERMLRTWQQQPGAKPSNQQDLGRKAWTSWCSPLRPRIWWSPRLPITRRKLGHERSGHGH